MIEPKTLADVTAIPERDRGYITISETVTETARIVLRPPTTEEMAQIKIAEGINEAAESRGEATTRRRRLSFRRPPV